jgi:hypothetical protein
MSNYLKLGIGVFMIALFLGYVGWTLLKTEKFLGTWPTTQGKVISIEIKKIPKNVSVNKRGQTIVVWAVIIDYTYSIRGTTYHGTIISNSAEYEDTSVYTQPTKALTQYLTKYPTESEVTVYYNPSKPEKSILEIDDTGSVYFLAIALVALISSIGLIVFSLYKK